MKKIIIAPDSFKGSLTASQVANSIERGVRAVFPDCGIYKIPVADGGEGTVDTLVEACGGEYVTVTVHDPLMRPIEACYGQIDGGRTAVIEMAAASGLTLVEPERRNPVKTTTYGTGELIRHAILRGCRRILVGIGGSATNDAGTGMLQALGYRFTDVGGSELGQGGEILSRIENIDESGRLPVLEKIELTVACDVNNPFFGPNGAAYVFAPQKGADPAMVEELDRGLKHFADVIRRKYDEDINAYPGAGAAGGLGGAFKAMLDAELVPGIRMVLDAVRFDVLLHGADLVITGEGKLDRQTVMGKAPGGILEAAKRAGVPVIAIGGQVEEREELIRQGFADIVAIYAETLSLEQAMQPAIAEANIERTVIRLMERIKNDELLGR